jgi:acyl transferase domain-containing protein/NADP-dependent 3-hydroxy acid dehydrogenase YdfG
LTSLIFIKRTSDMVTKKSPTKAKANPKRKANTDNKTKPYEDEPIAIVGMASQFPDADNLYDFWSNICQKKDSMTSVDEKDNMTYWDKDAFYDPNPSKIDKTYMFKAGFIKPIIFDPVEFKIPPVLIESISTAQLFALHVAKKAIDDANLLKENSTLDRSKVGVILGGAGNGNTAFSLLARNQTPLVRSAMVNKGIPGEVIDSVVDKLNECYIGWNEDSFPGFLGNVACGRIASFFDFGGTSNMVDAACGSSHAAIKSAVNELRMGSCDAVLTGGVNLENSIFSFLCFSKTPALSKSGICRPFDDKADGMLLGDGVGLVVLKRLSDAVANGDRIYSVIKSVEASSDGKAKSVFAPRDQGQVYALERSYVRTAISPEDIELIEAHGTGTASGDETELRSLGMVFGNYDIAPRTIAVGSIKSQIGHARCAAGAASLIKVSQALHHKVLPPTINVTTPNQFFSDESNPFYISAEARPWVKRDDNKPRCAATSGFGFGGTNYHIILEEFQNEHTDAYRQSNLPEVVVLSAESPKLLQQVAEQALTQWRGEDGVIKFREHLENQQVTVAKDSARLTLLVNDVQHAENLLEKVLPLITKQPTQDFEHPMGAFYRPQSLVENKDQVAVLFPGQGSQYLNMARDMAIEYPEFRDSLHIADIETNNKLDKRLSTTVYPVPVFCEEEEQALHAKLRLTEFTQPALGAVSAAYYKTLCNMGLEATRFAGHSYGELTALWASGAMTENQLYLASVERALSMTGSLENQSEKGVMYAVEACGTVVEQVLADYKNLVVANFNSPLQTVFAGAQDEAEQAAEKFAEKQLKCQKLNVDAAFHSPYIAQAQGAFSKVLKSLPFKAPKHPVYANTTAKPYGEQPAQIRDTLSSQLTSSVKFVELIEQMYADGVRVFIEVGPKGVLSNLVKNILGDKPFTVVPVNPSSSASAVSQFYKAVAHMISLGVELKHIDKYRLRQPLPSKPSVMAITLDGGNYATPKRREVMEKLRETDDHLIKTYVDEQAEQRLAKEQAKLVQTMANKDQELKQLRLANQDLEQQLEQKLQEVKWASNQVVNFNHASSNSTHNQITRELIMSQNDTNTQFSAVAGQLQAQQQLSDVHSQFQANQQQYLTMLTSVINHQQSALSEFRSHESFNQVLGHIDNTLSVLEKNQTLYHVNHEQYFRSQQALLGQVEHSGVSAASSISQVSVAQAPVAQAPVAQAPVAQAPVAQAPVAQAPVAQTPVAQAPVAQAPVAQAPVAQAPVAQAPLAQAPVAQAPVAQAPVAQAPVAQAPVAQAPVTQAPVADTSADNNALGGDAMDVEQRSYFESLDVDKISNMLVEIVSDKTGYPTDMIDSDMDLESDLGIDSIKRIEIFAALFERLWGKDSDDGIDEDNLDGDVNFDALNTIRRIAEFAYNSIQEVLNAIDNGAFVEQPIEAATPPEEPASEEIYVADADVKKKTQQIGFFVSTDTQEGAVKKSKLQSKSAASPSSVGRYIAKVEEFAKPDKIDVLPQQNHQWLVLANTKKSLILFDDTFKQLEQNTVGILVGNKKTNANSDFVLTECTEVAVQTLVEQVESKTKRKIAGVLYVADPLKQESLDNLYDHSQVFSLKALFMLAKVLQPKLHSEAAKVPTYFFTVGLNDGQFGTSSDSKSGVLNSALSGLVKSLNYEWSDVYCRHLDIQSSLTKKVVNDVFTEELTDPDRTISYVGRTKAQRYRQVLEQRTVSELQGKSVINEQSVLLVSGGAKGITAGCVIEFAKRYRCKFVLLGRSELKALPQWAHNANDDATLKKQAIAHLKAQNEPMTPAKVDALIRATKGIQEIQSTLDKLADIGSPAQYYSADVQDKDALKAVIEHAQTDFGSITGIIHGAGNLADKKIERKSLDDFALVFDTKIVGLQNILSLVDKSILETVLLFSSVSGFFGNAGQTDYSMSNEVLSRCADIIKRQYPNCLVRSINWGPWDGGMVNDVLKKAYESRNLVLIDKPTGFAACVNELNEPQLNATQIIIGGPEYHADKKPVSLQYAEPQIVNRILLPSATPGIKGHSVVGNIVLPAMFALHWMIEQGLNFYPGFSLSEVKEFAVLKGIVFDGKQGDDYKCIVTSNKEKGSKLQLTLEVTSIVDGKVIRHYRTDIALVAKSEPSKATLDASEIQGEQSLPFPIYHNGENGYLFHGKALQGIDTVVKHSEQNILATCQLTSEQVGRGQFNEVRQFNGFIADIFVQVPYLWLRHYKQKVGLPLGVEHIEKHRDISLNEHFYVSAEIVSCNQQTLTSDISVYNQRRELAYRIAGVKYTQLASISESENAFLKGVGEHEG